MERRGNKRPLIVPIVTQITTNEFKYPPLMGIRKKVSLFRRGQNLLILRPKNRSFFEVQ